ncbi:hypothetical protein CHUAL_011776 [Chamberlinius hualienensis]
MYKLFIKKGSIQALIDIRGSTKLPRCIHTGEYRAFWEPYRKGHKKYEPKKRTFSERLKLVRNSWPSLKEEIIKYKEEIREKLLMDAPFVRPGDSEYLFRFDDSNILKNFIVTSDKDHSEGYSECQLVVNENRKGVFKGILSNVMPNDGSQARTGYCNFTCKRPTKSFNREIYFQWIPYTHLIMRLRGDGRNYMINLHCSGEYDVHWNDMFSNVLYTRGGPYWQLAKIPFSRFFLMSKGRIQDRQAEANLNRITRLGITCADSNPGPFQLEIDYIALYFDPLHEEKSAYELYQAPKFTVNV